jgi:hypothetical protein
MGKNQNKLGNLPEATEENSREIAQKAQKNREWTRIDANKPKGENASLVTFVIFAVESPRYLLH